MRLAAGGRERSIELHGVAGVVAPCSHEQEPKIAAQDSSSLHPASSPLRGFSSSLRQNCLDLVAESFRMAPRHSRKMGKAGRRLPGGSASVCTSKARARDFFERKAQTNSSIFARSAGASSRRRYRSSDEKLFGNVRLAGARSAREQSGCRSVRAARYARKSHLFLIQSNRSPRQSGSAA